jgi:hypothetical protein
MQQGLLLTFLLHSLFSGAVSFILLLPSKTCLRSSFSLIPTLVYFYGLPFYRS